ncbi:hypothetical protein BDN70DRAFT_242012 [Pholiota conissans]|uniref:Zinc-ribbon 15 domain-containing protein n=1 Tax=Pholiota conissans TaxID=109636 RepID=A0A9P5Z8Z4_9AGAR|nr:hypothetical protein BDN70DRAFT_242012 [Pholiota conissans]
MDFCFFVPVIFGCTTKISADGDQTPRICPRCHNAAVSSAKSKEYFELCFVPLIPMSSKHIWRCSICQWSVLNQAGSWEPQPVTNVPTQPGGYYPAQPGQYQQGPAQYQGPPPQAHYGK